MPDALWVPRSCNLPMLVRPPSRSRRSGQESLRLAGECGLGAVLTNCAVRAVRVVVLDVLPQHCREVALSDRQGEVEAFTPQGE
jgi:hypothetical protein